MKHYKTDEKIIVSIRGYIKEVPVLFNVIKEKETGYNGVMVQYGKRREFVPEHLILLPNTK